MDSTLNGRLIRLVSIAAAIASLGTSCSSLESSRDHASDMLVALDRASKVDISGNLPREPIDNFRKYVALATLPFSTTNRYDIAEFQRFFEAAELHYDEKMSDLFRRGGKLSATPLCTIIIDDRLNFRLLGSDYVIFGDIDAYRSNAYKKREDTSLVREFGLLLGRMQKSEKTEPSGVTSHKMKKKST